MLTKKIIPLQFLLCISIFWALFDQSSTIFNDFGNHNPEWLLIIDGFMVLPILCWLFTKDKKEAVITVSPIKYKLGYQRYKTLGYLCPEFVKQFKNKKITLAKQIDTNQLAINGINEMLK